MDGYIKHSRILCIIIAVLITALGFGTMFLTTTIRIKLAKQTDMTLPSAGISGVIEKYSKATGDSSIDLLSTTALMAGLQEYNEYYDKKGNIIGKTIVFTGDHDAVIYSKATGYARIERNEEEGIPVGVIKKNSPATLLAEHKDNWYEIVSGGVKGFIKKDLFVTGKEAEKLDKDTYETLVYANVNNAYVYAEPDTYSEVIYCAPEGIGFTTLAEDGDFTKIALPNNEEGWIQTADITVKTTRKSALSTDAEADRSKKIADGKLIAQAIKDQEISAELAAELEAVLAAERQKAYERAMENYDGGTAGQSIVNFASQFVGWLPYVWGGSSLVDGADCSGFAQAVFGACGYSIPRTTDAMLYGEGGVQIPLDQIMPGDIICYGSHVAIYAGGDTIIHESVPGTNCKYDSMYIMPIYGAVRYAFN